MMRKSLPKLMIILMMLFLASCEGKQATGHAQCVGDKNPKSEYAADGSEIKPLEEIEKFIKEKKIISTIVGKVKGELLGQGFYSGQASVMFNSIMMSPEYRNAISAAFGLYIIIYGFSVIAGLVQVTIGGAAIRVAKMAFITTFALSWGEFYSLVVLFFVNGMDELMAFFLQAFQKIYVSRATVEINQDIVFGDLDIFISRIFSIHTFAMMSAFMSEKNVSYMAVLALSLFHIFMAIIQVVQMYIFAIFALSLLFALAPIFLAFMLFKQTNDMFRNWIGQMINYVLQPVFASAFLGMYIGILAPIFQDFLNYKVCYGPTEAADGSEGWYFVDPNDPANRRLATAINSKPQIELQTMFLMLIFSWLFGSNIRFAVGLAGSISMVYGANLDNLKSIMRNVGSGTTGKGPIDSLLSKLN